jgi:tetrahydromethanopterin S-methyltransferase subunit G
MADERDDIQKAADWRNMVDRLDEMIEKVERMSPEEWREMVRRNKKS